MAEKEITTRMWIKNFKDGMYRGDEDYCEAGWYDWFCKTSSLKNKTLNLGRIVKKIKEGGKVNLDTTYVWFKNNCPCYGPLYDDFRIADLETGNVLFTTAVDDVRNNHRYVVYGRKNGPTSEFESEPLFETDDRKELVNWFNTNW